MPSSRLDATALRSLLKDAVDAVTGGVLPGRHQPTTNSIGIYLAWRWALEGERGPRSNVYVYASKHPTAAGVDHFTRLPPSMKEELGPRLREYQFLTDVFITRHSRQNAIERTLLAAEIEASPNHRVEYAYEGDNYNDYLWDFSKLLHVKAPKHLLVACAPPERLGTLAETLAQGYRDARGVQGAEETCVCLLPSTTDWSEVRLGVVDDTGELRFES